MNSKRAKLIGTLSNLYELSLSIGRSLNLNENCQSFFQKLTQRVSIDFITILEIKGRNFNQLFSLPRSFINCDNCVDNIHIQRCNEIVEIDKLEGAILEKGNHWNYFYFRKGRFIIFFIKNKSSAFETKLFSNQLSPLFDLFCTSVEACLSHSLLLNEVIRRHDLEERLYNRESMLKSVVKSLNDGILVTDGDENVIYFNERFIDITELSKQELHRKKAIPLLNELITSEDLSMNAEMTLTRSILRVKTEGEKIVDMKKTTFRNIANKVSGSIFSLTDVTENVKLFSKIQKQRLELQDLVENMYDAVFIVSTDGTLTKANKSGIKLIEIKPDELGLINLTDLIVSEDKERFFNSYFKRLRTEGFYSQYEGRIITRQGNLKHVEVNSTAIFKNGILVGSRDIVREVTQRKMVEIERKYEKEKLSKIIDGALDAVVSIDAQGRIVDWNNQAVKIFGYKKKEVKHKPLINTIIPNSYKKAHLAGMENFFKTGTSSVLNKRVEIDAQNKWGTVFPIELTIIPIETEIGLLFSSFIRDISDRKRLEKEQIKLINEAEQLNQELRDFAYLVSHDLKAPLRGIGSIVDWITDDYEELYDEKGKELLQLLKDRLKRMYNLIDDILNYSRIGRLESSNEIIKPYEVITDVIETLEIPPNCQINIQPNMPRVFYDYTRLYQVFQNLISNALKFNDKDRAIIDIHCFEVDEFIRFEVKDNGIGIAPKYHDKVFQIFQTLGERNREDDTGIGLSIVKRIIELGGGTVTLTSKLGTGCTFAFTIKKNESNIIN